MAGDITLALRTAQSGLLANQSALNFVAQNIANANTDGYSRTIVNFEERVLAGSGAGVQISELTRRVDEGLLKSLRLELTGFKSLDVQETYFARMQEVFGSPEDDSSIAHIINNFAEALESLAFTPDKSLEQREAVRWGTEVARMFQQASETLQDLRQQADVAIAAAVDEINDLVTRIGDLNDKIIRNSTVNLRVTDLLDERDRAVDRLSELVDIRTFRRSDGDIVVFTEAGRTLVDNVPGVLTHSPAANVTPTTTHAEGDFGGIFVGTQITGNDITTELRGGEMYGLVQLRDHVLPDLQSEMDELAAELRDAVNQVHNRGLSFPGSQSLTGTRAFTEPATSTVTFGGTTDTTIALFDDNGDVVSTNTLRTLLGGASGTVNDVVTAINTFLGADGTATLVNGALQITVTTAGRNLAFRDEAATATNSARQDATIQFDANADATTDETVNGFSHFFGLNDFFTDSLVDNVHETNVMATTFTAAGAATLTFRGASGLIGTAAVTAGDSLSTIASTINNTVTGVTASVVPDGAGERLRISSDDGTAITVTQAAGNTFLTNTGMHSADVRVASSLSVRTDIEATPTLVARGAIQFDTNRGAAGEYFVSVGDDTVIQEWVAVMTSSNTFDAAGSISNISTTFTDHAAAIVSGNATAANLNETDLEFQRGLVDSLQAKSDNLRGVNVDEELSDLILFEQAFTASSRVIAVVKDMFDALDQAVL